MSILKRFRLEIIATFSFAFLYFATRLYQIMSLPIFTDEAIYTRWAQIAKLDSNWRFISLTDGKQPLFIWLDMVTMKFVSDPLLSGRLVSVFAGFATMVGIYFLGKMLFNKRVGLISSLLYIFYPFALVYDRMALYDSLVATFAVWALLFQVLLFKYKRLDLALILGFILGGGILNKTSGFISIYLLPFSLLLINLKQKIKFNNLFKWAGLAALSVLLAYGFYSVLRLSPFLYIVDEKNSIFVYTFSQWISHPFDFLEGNLRGVLDWAYTYLTLPVIILISISFLINKKNIREKLLLFAWFAVPFIALAVFGKTLYPRFIFFMTIPLLILAAYSLAEITARIKTNNLKIFAFIVFMFLMLRSDFYILNDFKRSPIPRLDLEQYINGWPAGGGTNEVIGILAKESKKEKIYVASLGTFGSLPTYSVEIYLGENKNIDKRGIYPVPPQIPEDLLVKAKSMPVFLFVSNQSEFEEQIKNWPLKLITQYQKGIGYSYSKLYKVTP